ANTFGLGAQHRHHRRAMLGENANQAVQEGLPAKFQQRFRKSHAARFAGGQNQTSDIAHWIRVARRASSLKTDFASERQFDAAPRRTAIISAATEMAISSGEIAPISSPMGANIR